MEDDGVAQEPMQVHGTSPRKHGPGEYTLEDYYALPGDVRAELIDGEFFFLDAPGVAHQRISGEIFNSLFNHIRKKGGSCEVFSAPFDVRLRDDRDDIVEPDVVVVCDGSKLRDGKRCNGAPNLVVEILSPSTRARDMGLKRRKYEEAGVREYWVVDPVKRVVMISLYGDEADQVDGMFFHFEDRIPVAIFGGECEIDLSGVPAAN